MGSNTLTIAGLPSLSPCYLASSPGVKGFQRGHQFRQGTILQNFMGSISLPASPNQNGSRNMGKLSGGLLNELRLDRINQPGIRPSGTDGVHPAKCRRLFSTGCQKVTPECNPLNGGHIPPSAAATNSSSLLITIPSKERKKSTANEQDNLSVCGASAIPTFN